MKYRKSVLKKKSEFEKNRNERARAQLSASGESKF